MSMGIDSLRARSGACFPGLEPEVAPLLDVMLPSERVVDAIKPLRGSFQRSHCDYTSAHPLAASQVNAPDAARPSSTRSHRLFYIHRRPGLWRHRRSRLADLGSEHDPLLAGFGWGNMRNRPRRSNGRSAKASKSAQSGGAFVMGCDRRRPDDLAGNQENRPAGSGSFPTGWAPKRAPMVPQPQFVFPA